MPTYDWVLMAHRSGESIESLIATLLRLEYGDARQVNPSQGDGGIDIIRETSRGVIVWQVKGFTTALSPSQFGQVKSSWARFSEEHLGAGKPTVLEYHLVTPWTPTEERIAAFRDLTEGSGVNCVWDGDAYVAGFADKHPATMRRFIYGDGAFEQFVTQKALIASSPVERGDSTTMLGAIETRQDALDDLRDQLSDNYRIDHGTLTAVGDGVPLQLLSTPAIFHQMEFLGNGRWKYQSLVPRSADAAEVEPISFEVSFLEEAGSEGAAAIQEWAEWGTPFASVRGSVRMVGGPLPDLQSSDREAETRLSFSEVERDSGPPLFLRCADAGGSTRFRLPLTTVVKTIGGQTGWMRLVAETPEGLMRFELRVQGRQDMTVSAEIGDLRGRDPESVLTELTSMLQMQDGDSFTFEMNPNLTLFKAQGMILPPVLEEFVQPIAQSLVSLQKRTTTLLHMPNLSEVTDGQFEMLMRYESIYQGHAYVWEWKENSLFAPNEIDEVPKFVDTLRALTTGERMAVVVDQPVIKLGDDRYQIDHPIATTRHSIRLASGLDLDAVTPNARVVLVPGEDKRVTTAMVADWTPGSIF